MALLLGVFIALVACGDAVESEALECQPGSAGEDCAPCQAGTFCAGGDAPPVDCGDGTWDHDENPATPCSPWTDCSAGEFIATPGDAMTNRVCESCEEGSFSSGENALGCETFTRCVAGEFVEQRGGATSDQACAPCPEGTFSEILNAISCQAWTSCPPGQFAEVPGSSIGDRQCADCVVGTYSSEENASSCEPWTECQEHEFELLEGTPSMDRQCAPLSEAGSPCSNDQECASHECQRGYCKLAGWSVIPAGVFIQGSPPTEPGRFSDEGPQREVTITRPFLIQETPVTQAQWEALMGNNPSAFQSGSNEDRPVDRATWWDAVAYVNSLSTLEGLDECYTVSSCTGSPGNEGYSCVSVSFAGLDCEGYRLPTEAEWEYAARAETTAMTYAGDHHGESQGCPETTLLSSIAWWCENAAGMTHPVAQKAPNQWGLYDILGNVWEWTWDRYSNSAYQTGAITDPTGPSAGTGRVARGCSWDGSAAACRAARRSDRPATNRNFNVGFRPARTIP